MAVAVVPRESPRDAAPRPGALPAEAGLGTTVLPSAPHHESKSRPVPEEDTQSRLAWRSPRLEFSGTPLIALRNRPNRVQFTIDDPESARTRVSGIFGALHTGSFVRLLESSVDGQSGRAARSAGRVPARPARLPGQTVGAPPGQATGPERPSRQAPPPQ